MAQKKKEKEKGILIKFVHADFYELNCVSSAVLLCLTKIIEKYPNLWLPSFYPFCLNHYLLLNDPNLHNRNEFQEYKKSHQKRVSLYNTVRERMTRKVLAVKESVFHIHLIF